MPLVTVHAAPGRRERSLPFVVEALPPGPRGELDAIAQAVPPTEAVELVLDGVRAQVQALADLLIGQPVREQLQQLQVRGHAGVVAPSPEQLCEDCGFSRRA